MMVLLIVSSVALASTAVLAIVVVRLTKKVNATAAASELSTPLRIPYVERLKAEYAKRGLVYVPPVTTTDG
jgi:hypothetical protein